MVVSGRHESFIIWLRYTRNSYLVAPLALSQVPPYTIPMTDYTPYKTILEKEQLKLEVQLNRLGARDARNPENWDVKVSDIDVLNADENEAADRTEETHIDSIVLDELETRYRLVLHALRNIKAGSYGTCAICSGPIEADRLDANPAARSCKAHLGQEEGIAL